MKRTLASVALLATLLTAGSASALVTVSKEVSLKGVDFNDPAEVRRLYQTLRTTAREVCRQADAKSVSLRQPDLRCARAALDEAVTRLDQPALRMVHRGPAAVQVASRAR